MAEIKVWILPNLIRYPMEMEQGLRLITELLLGKMQDFQ
jgi:hypothetical protein